MSAVQRRQIGLPVWTDRRQPHRLIVACLVFMLAGRLIGVECQPRSWHWSGVGLLERLRLISLLETEFQETDLPMPVLMDEVAYRVTTWFETKGFLKATVSVKPPPIASDPAEVPEEAAGAPVLVVDCNRGPRYRLGGVQIQGASALTVAELEVTFLGGFDQFWPWSTRWFSDQAYRRGTGAVAAYYQRRGWTDVLVDPSDPILRGDGKVDVALAIHEGIRFMIQSIEVESEEPLRDEKTKALLDSYRGKPYRETVPSDLGVMVAYAYRAQGYPFCEVALEEEIDPETGSVLLRYRVVLGPKGTVRSVGVRGNVRTAEPFVLKVAGLKQDRVYDQRAVDKASLRLARTRLFQTAQIAPRPIEGHPEEVHLDVRVEEAHTKEFSTMAGWGSYEMLRGSVNYTHRNLFHRGHQSSTGGMMSLKSERLYTDYTVPYIYGLNVSESVGAFWTHREEPSFERREYGVKEGLTLDVGSNAYLRGGYEFRQSDVYNIDSQEVQEEEGDAQLSLISMGALYDSRDSPVLTYRGLLINGNIEWGDQAWGSQVDFIRPTVQTSAFWNPLDRWVLAGSLRIGTEIRVQGGEQIPIQERFFIGGQDTVRGYREGEVGPRDEAGFPIGGERMVVLNLEARYRLWKELELAGFADAGQVAVLIEDDYDAAWQGGLGLGLRYRTPIGPLRLDWAKAVNRTRYDPSSRFYFSIGYPF